MGGKKGNCARTLKLKKCASNCPNKENIPVLLDIGKKYFELVVELLPDLVSKAPVPHGRGTNIQRRT